MLSTEFLTKLIRRYAESQAKNAQSAGNYLTLMEAINALQVFLVSAPAETVRDGALEIAVAAMRIACNGCDAVEDYRLRNDLDSIRSDLAASSEGQHHD